MTSVVWFYLGGLVGQVALTASNDDCSRALKIAMHKGGWRAALGYLIGLALWPLTSLLFVFFYQALIKHLEAKNQTQVVKVRCEVCELEDETRVTGRWVQDPPHWLFDTKGSDAFFCSYRCASHWEKHHEGKVAK
jgi:hypothetical protein